MIMRRLRAKAAIYISGMLVALGCGLTASATQPVTKSEMESFVFASLAAGGVAVIGGFWVLLNALLGPMRKSIENIEAHVARSLDAVRLHDENEHAHSAASEHNHKPMNDDMKEVKQKLDRLIHEHELIHAGCQIQAERDPKESPFKRRSSDDSGDDFTPIRGHKP